MCSAGSRVSDSIQASDEHRDKDIKKKPHEIETEMEMEMEAAARRPRVLAEIDPHSVWVHGREFDVLVVDVTGFSKEQLKVQVEPSGSLKVSGERADDGGGRQWCHFTKRFDLPAGCDPAAITVQLDKGMLYIQIQVPRPRGAASARWGTEHEQQRAEVYEDAMRGEDETSDDDVDGHRGGWNIGRRHGDGEHHPLRRLAMGLSRHRQVVLNVVLAVVLLWLVAFAKNKQPGGGGGQAPKND